jgi:hypothetical protein
MSRKNLSCAVLQNLIEMKIKIIVSDYYFFFVENHFERLRKHIE